MQVGSRIEGARGVGSASLKRSLDLFPLAPQEEAEAASKLPCPFWDVLSNIPDGRRAHL